LERVGEIFLGLGPLERNARASPYLQSGAAGRDRFLEPRRPTLSLPELPEGIAEIALRRGPLEWNALAGLRANTASVRDLEKYATDRAEPIGQGHHFQISWVDKENGDDPE